MIYNFFYLYPVEQFGSSVKQLPSDTFWQTIFLILKNRRNWLDFIPQANSSTLAVLFLGLGFFCSSQTLGFTWLTKNMRPELVGRNSAFNSMLFMVTNAGFKQLGASLLSIPPLFSFDNAVSASNLLALITICMLLAGFYGLFRKPIFSKDKLSINIIQ